MGADLLDYFICASAIVVGGVQVISPTEVQKNHPKAWKYGWMGFTVLLCLAIGWQKFLAHRDHIAELQTNNDAVKDAVGGVNKTLSDIKGDLQRVAETAKVPVTESTKEMADAIIAKIEMRAAVTGNGNTTDQTKNDNSV